MLLQSDPQLEAGLQFGFEREGVRVRKPEEGETVAEALDDDLQLVVVGGNGRDDALALLSRVRGALMARETAIPVLYVGNGINRKEAIKEGATEIIEQPTYVRDVITVARFLCSPVKQLNSALTGELSDHFGLFYMIRALASVRRRGVLTLIRGLRRGELRFYDGEVTSAQVGVMHGVAALHQLLLWTDARFELRPENVVHRQQIPLTRSELIANSEKFLSDIREVAEGMSPSAVYELKSARAEEAQASAPREVVGVLALFDGTRTVADVIEDSPFRVFETLRIANRLHEFGAIAKKPLDKPRATARAALAIEEWLVDSGPAPRVVDEQESDAIGPPPGEPASPPKKKKKRRKKKRKKGAKAGPPRSFDWSSLIPDRPSGLSDGDGFSQVVPASSASGEIGIARLTEQSDRAARDDDTTDAVVPPAREKLEEVVDKEKLQAMFSSADPTAEESSGDREPAKQAEPVEAEPVEAEPVEAEGAEDVEDTEDVEDKQPEPAAPKQAAKGWQVDTEPLSDDDLEEVDESDGVPTPTAKTASGEIKLPAAPKFLSSPAPEQAVVVEPDTEPIPDESLAEPEPEPEPEEAKAEPEEAKAEPEEAEPEEAEPEEAEPEEAEPEEAEPEKAKAEPDEPEPAPEEAKAEPEEPEPEEPDQPEPAEEPAAEADAPVAEDVPALEPVDDDDEYDDVESGVIDTAEIAANRGRSPVDEGPVRSVELSGGATASGEISTQPTERASEPDERDSASASGEFAAREPEPEPEVEPDTETRRKRRRPTASRPDTARGAAAAIQDAVRKRSAAASSERAEAEQRARPDAPTAEPDAPSARPDAPSGKPQVRRAKSESGPVFTEDEEAFFSEGAKLADQQPDSESFEDLDEDYEVPKTFWQRFMSKPDKAPTTKKRRKK